MGRDLLAVEDEYGASNPLVIMVPKGDISKESQLNDALKADPDVTSVISYVNTVGAAQVAQGASELKDNYAQFDTQIDDAINEATDKYSGTDFTPVSFASDENIDIGLVQFAMKTEAISIADDDEEEETVEEDKSFVQKLKDLF